MNVQLLIVKGLISLVFKTSKTLIARTIALQALQFRFKVFKLYGNVFKEFVITTIQISMLSFS
jgi:hypothetical protein